MSETEIVRPLSTGGFGSSPATRRETQASDSDHQCVVPPTLRREPADRGEARARGVDTEPAPPPFSRSGEEPGMRAEACEVLPRPFEPGGHAPSGAVSGEKLRLKTLNPVPSPKWKKERAPSAGSHRLPIARFPKGHGGSPTARGRFPPLAQQMARRGPSARGETDNFLDGLANMFYVCSSSS